MHSNHDQLPRSRLASPNRSPLEIGNRNMFNFIQAKGNLSDKKDVYNHTSNNFSNHKIEVLQSNVNRLTNQHRSLIKAINNLTHNATSCSEGLGCDLIRKVEGFLNRSRHFANKMTEFRLRFEKYQLERQNQGLNLKSRSKQIYSELYDEIESVKRLLENQERRLQGSKEQSLKYSECSNQSSSNNSLWSPHSRKVKEISQIFENSCKSIQSAKNRYQQHFESVGLPNLYGGYGEQYHKDIEAELGQSLCELEFLKHLRQNKQQVSESRQSYLKIVNQQIKTIKCDEKQEVAENVTLGLAEQEALESETTEFLKQAQTRILYKMRIQLRKLRNIRDLITCIKCYNQDKSLGSTHSRRGYPQNILAKYRKQTCRLQKTLRQLQNEREGMLLRKYILTSKYVGVEKKLSDLGIQRTNSLTNTMKTFVPHQQKMEELFLRMHQGLRQLKQERINALF